MTQLAQLRELEAIVEARYQHQQQSFGRLVAEENRLRSELARMDGYLKDTRAMPDTETEMRAIGADIVWQSWVGRSKAQLNVKLAQVLSIKEQHLKKVRLAYGKVLVTQDLIAQSIREDRTKSTRAVLARAVEQSLFG